MKKSSDYHLCQGPASGPTDKDTGNQAELIEKVRNSLGFTVDDFNRLVFAGDPAVCRVCSPVASFRITPPPWRWWSVPTWALKWPSGQLRHLSQLSFSIEGTPRERAVTMSRVGDWRAVFSGLLHDVGKPLSGCVHYGQRRVNHMEPVFGVTS